MGAGVDMDEGGVGEMEANFGFIGLASTKQEKHVVNRITIHEHTATTYTHVFYAYLGKVTHWICKISDPHILN